jgi:hypothetical protein
MTEPLQGWSPETGSQGQTNHCNVEQIRKNNYLIG